MNRANYNDAVNNMIHHNQQPLRQDEQKQQPIGGLLPSGFIDKLKKEWNDIYNDVTKASNSLVNGVEYIKKGVDSIDNGIKTFNQGTSQVNNALNQYKTYLMIFAGFLMISIVIMIILMLIIIKRER